MSIEARVRSRLSERFSLDVDIDAPAGITIVFGASGSGKSTLLRAVAGLQRPDAGRITVGGRTVFDSGSGQWVEPQHRRVGYVAQQLALFPHLSIRQNLEYGLTAQSRQEREGRVREIAERFHIDGLLDRRPGDISGGERQRAALARSLVTDPDVLLLDEPLSALDHATQSRIIGDLRAWNAAHGIPVLYVTHAHREVFALGERVVVLDRGRVLSIGTPHEVIDLPAHETIAQLAGFENLFTAVVVARREQDGVMQCRLDRSSTDLEVPIGVATIGVSIRIAIRAGDILLSTEEPRGLSARNILAGRIVSLEREGSRVVGVVDAGERFVVHLTPGAVESLSLRPGQDAWLVVKTHSCRVAAL